MHTCKDTQSRPSHTPPEARQNCFSSLVRPLAWWKSADERVDHALSPRLTSSAAGPAHHQTAAGTFTRSTVATSQGTMRKCFTLWLCLPSKLAKWVWGTYSLPYTVMCPVGAAFGRHVGSLGSSVAGNSCWELGQQVCIVAIEVGAKFEIKCGVCKRLSTQT